MSRMNTESPAPVQAETRMTESGAMSLSAPFAANLVMSEIATQITQEMVDFAGRRLRAQMDFVSTMPVGDVTGMMEAQFRFFAQATRDYAAEMAQVTEVMRKAGELPAAKR